MGVVRGIPAKTMGGGAEDAHHIFDGRDVSPGNLERIGASYAADGFVCLRLLSADTCDKQV